VFTPPSSRGHFHGGDLCRAQSSYNNALSCLPPRNAAAGEGPAPAADAEGDAAVPSDGASSASASGAASIFLKLAFFLGAALFFALSDGLSSLVLTITDPATGRPLHMFTVALANAAGFLLSAWAVSGVGYLMASLQPDGSSDAATQSPATVTGASVGAVLGGNALLLAGNFCGSMAWYGVVKLGTSAEMSSFLPIVSLDTFIPPILSVIFLGEAIGLGGYAGMALACSGVVLIATSS
jgi:drug/metabolite transporter (DMT)-like permease